MCSCSHGRYSRSRSWVKAAQTESLIERRSADEQGRGEYPSSSGSHLRGDGHSLAGDQRGKELMARIERLEEAVSQQQHSGD